MKNYIKKKKFKDINLEYPFFDSLKDDYKEFSVWFQKKANEEAYVLYNGDFISGFMYLKVEDGEVVDTRPPLPSKKRIKIGTFKIDAHGTKLGERFIKKAIDHAVSEKADEIYVTIFEKHTPLIELLDEFGFQKRGRKESENGEESVLIKDLKIVMGNLRKDYPLIYARGKQKFLLSIYPEWHTKLFPDSILNNESYDVVRDISHTNSIQKTYVCFMDLSLLRNGDIIIIYRTNDKMGSAWYRSVVTSVCTVEEIRSKRQFVSADEYIRFTEKFSVFDEKELMGWWNRGNRLYVIKMLYNAAFSKRLIRKNLVEKFGLDPNSYWGFMKISDEQFTDILSSGGVDESIVIS